MSFSVVSNIVVIIIIFIINTIIIIIVVAVVVWLITCVTLQTWNHTTRKRCMTIQPGRPRNCPSRRATSSKYINGSMRTGGTAATTMWRALCRPPTSESDQTRQMESWLTVTPAACRQQPRLHLQYLWQLTLLVTERNPKT